MFALVVMPSMVCWKHPSEYGLAVDRRISVMTINMDLVV